MRFLNRIINKFKRDSFKGLLFAAAKKITGFNIYKQKMVVREFEKILKLSSNKKRFSEIYKKKLWGDGESVSGNGSSYESTKAIRNWLVANIPKLNLTTIVDAPCGDFHWMKEVVSKVDFTYKGFDIVEPLIKKNQDCYATNKVTFEVADICEDTLPNCDLLIVRDILFHLSLTNISKFLKNIASVKYRYLITTNYRVRDDFSNKDIRSGDFRIISLLHPPFNFREKDIYERIDEGLDGMESRELLIFKKEDVPTA